MVRGISSQSSSKRSQFSKSCRERKTVATRSLRFLSRWTSRFRIPLLTTPRPHKSALMKTPRIRGDRREEEDLSERGTCLKSDVAKWRSVRSSLLLFFIPQTPITQLSAAANFTHLSLLPPLPPNPHPSPKTWLAFRLQGTAPPTCGSTKATALPTAIRPFLLTMVSSSPLRSVSKSWHLS